jgi:hypothetical protein
MIQIIKYVKYYELESFSVKRCLSNAPIEQIPTTKVDDKIDIKKYKLLSFIPSADNSQLYYGVYLPDIKNKNDNDNFVITNSLKSNKWTKYIKNGKLDDKSIIIDLCYDTNKRLFCIGMYMDNNEPIYNLYKKENNNYKSKWVKINSTNKIKSLCYDNKINTLLGINSYDSQIYENKFESVSYNDWIGPLNYDIPMRKILYDKDDYMIGIDLKNNYIYRKENKDWRTSSWDTKNINKTKVYDLCYDYDGCFIALTSDGVKKQKFPDFNADFIPIEDYNMNKNSEILTKANILKYKIGFDFLNELFDSSTEFGKNLKKIYNFKKLTKDICGNKRYLYNKIKKNKFNTDIQNINQNDINKQNREINELYDNIEKLSNELNY